MNVVGFYLSVGALLAFIFFVFQPIELQEAPKEPFAQIELNGFFIHELNENGIKTILAGAHAKRFEDRYEVMELNITDRNPRHHQSMQAGFGVYKEPFIALHGDVRYRRDDGLHFQSNQAFYDRNTTIATTAGAFTLWQNNDSVQGVNLVLNNTLGEAWADRVTGIYEIRKEQ